MNRYVQTIFCDDIRHEIGGKLSYIGVYSGKMLVPQFPIILPKLCLVLQAVSPVEDPFHRLSIRVLKDDETIADGEVEEQELANAENALDDIPDDERSDRLQTFHAQFMFSPFAIEKPCTLRVRVGTRKDELPGLGLRIEQHLAAV